MTKQSLISIIIPTYNRVHLLWETLDSVLAQSYQNWECIVVDDGSTDGTQRIMTTYCERDSRFQYHSRPTDRPKGANSCRNYGFEMSKGNYVNWFDSDDIMHHDFLTLKINEIENSTLDGVISKTKIFKNEISNICGKENRTKLTENTLEDFLQLKIVWYLPDVLWKREFLQKKNLFDEELLAGQDRDFHARMLIHQPSLKIIDKYLVYYRKHEYNITTDVNNAKNQILRRSHLSSLVKLVGLLKKENKFSKDLRVFYHGSVIKYLPSVITSKEYFSVQVKLLNSLTFMNFKIIINWIKFFLAFISLKLIGKGERLLR